MGKFDRDMFTKLHLSLNFPLAAMLPIQGDIVRDGGEGGVDVLQVSECLTAFCRGAVPRDRASFPVGELHLLDLVVNQHDESAGDHQDTNEEN